MMIILMILILIMHFPFSIHQFNFIIFKIFLNIHALFRDEIVI